MDEPPRNANAARARGGAAEKIRQVGQRLDNKTDAQKQLLSELAAARRHLERRAYATVTMLDWKVELQRRIAIAESRFEAIGLDADEQHALQAEVDEFRRVARYLCWTGRRP
jgi:hypothetical protein